MTHIIKRVPKKKSPAERRLKAPGIVVIVALYKVEYKGEAISGVIPSRAVIKANSFPISSWAATEAIIERFIGEKTLLNSDKDVAGRIKC